jgi:ABC-2 type transport system ATP-binding protein
VTATVTAPAAEGRVAGDAPPVAVERLSKRYGDVVAVSDVSFTVGAGEAVGLLGPNGAGKTTTMKTLAGLVRPSAGRVALFGLPAHDPRARVRVGYLPELFRFPEWLTGRRVLDLHARLAGVPAGERADRIDAALERVGLAGRGDERVRGYSKGMSQRLGLAQALLARPALVLLDEPTSALDPLGRRLVREVIRELTTGGTAVLLNSHLLTEVESVCHRIVILDRGRVRREETVQQLVGTAHTELRLRVDRVDDALLAALARHGAVAASDDASVTLHVLGDTAVAAVAREVVACGRDLLALVPVPRSLEDAYVELVGESDQ